MSLGIRKELKRLCQCLIYMAALRICPAVRRKTRLEGGRPAGLSPAHSEGRAARGAEERKPSGALEAIGRAISISQQSGNSSKERITTVSGIEVFIYEFRDEVLEFCSRAQSEEKAVKPRFGRTIKATRSPGLDSIKVTLNLARGNLDESVLAF